MSISDLPRTQSDGRPTVSACVIVKNEAHNLPDCLTPLRQLVGEIVVVDTGSTDGTADVARQLEARVESFAWVDSFAAARNESLRHATGDWVFWLDADDRLDADNAAKLAALLQALPDANVGFVMKCLCLVGLAELYLGQARWAEFDAALGWLGDEMDACVLRARGHLARREFNAARGLLAEAIAREPRSLLPRVVMSYVWLQEGRDLDAAERALCDVLALCPDHAEARRNLAVLRAQRRMAAADGNDGNAPP